MTRRRKLVKPLAAGLGLAATIASVWWFALKPRRKRAAGPGSSPAANSSPE